jgi:hypothetical protein
VKGDGKKEGLKLSEIEGFISVLGDSDVKSNCSICNRGTKVNSAKNAVDLFKVDNRVECKRCIISIASRKYAHEYTVEYLLRYNKRYFTVENVRQYVNEEFEHADQITNTIAIIVRDLASFGAVGIYSRQRNGHRYVVLNSSLLKERELAEYATVKGFGFKDGVKIKASA